MTNTTTTAHTATIKGTTYNLIVSAPVSLAPRADGLTTHLAIGTRPKGTREYNFVALMDGDKIVKAW